MFEGLSLAHVLVVGVAVLVLFGRGKVSSMMGEVGRGITAFRKGMIAEPEEAQKPPIEKS